ncbi:alpha/beta hydrolase, partial [bacterium]
MKLAVLLSAALLSTTVSIPIGHAQTAAAKPQKPRPTQRLVFKATTDSAGAPVQLHLNVFEPVGHKKTDKTPVFVFFYGGGWNSGNPNVLSEHCAYFASRGIVAIAPEYRVKNREGTTPFECVADGKSAIRYVRAHAAELGIDPNRVVAAGTSAGGHVAASAAIILGLDEKGEDLKVSSVPNALVLYNPVVDTSPEGFGNKRLQDRWREISPLQ